MNIAVFSAWLGLAGGGEAVAIAITRALEEAGYKVSLVTYSFEPGDYKRALELLSPGYEPRNIVVYKIPFRVRLLSSTGRFIRFTRLLLADHFLVHHSTGYDLIIDASLNTPYWPDIAYIHYPMVLRDPSKHGLHWRIYNWLVETYGSQVRKRGRRARLVLCNSTWTAKKFREAYGDEFKTIVLHPPVSIEYFEEASLNNNREKLVVTITRFTPEKRLNRILNVAEKLPDYRFIIAGGMAKYSRPVVESLEKGIRENKLENIELMPNAPREKIKEILSRAKYYLHPEFPEHFGIAIVEAMSAGLVPIVYRDGGAWTDVVSKISELLGYDRIEEAAEIIRRIDEKPELYNKLREKAKTTAREFRYEEFKKKLLEAVSTIL